MHINCCQFSNPNLINLVSYIINVQRNSHEWKLDTLNMKRQDEQITHIYVGRPPESREHDAAPCFHVCILLTSCYQARLVQK